MKKKALLSLSFFLALVILPVISAAEINLKDEFKQGETLIAKISGNFQEPIQKENIIFYRGHVKIPISFGIGKIRDEYYVYAQLLDKTPGNYSFSIEDTEYVIGSRVVDDAIIKNFTISNKTADFKIESGFIITNKGFSVELQNLQSYSINVKIKTKTISGGGDEGGFLDFLFGSSNKTQDNLEQETTIALKSGEIKKVDFSIENIKQTTFKTIEFNTDDLSYNIPVYIFTNQTGIETPKEKSFRFEPNGLNVSTSTNSNTTRIIYLYNTGEADIEGISISISDSLKPYISFSLDKIDELKANSSIQITLYLIPDNEEKIIEGQIKAKTDDGFYAYFALILNFIKDYKPLPGQNESIVFGMKTCAEMNGTICKDNEECNGSVENAKDNVCCIGFCEEKGQDNTGKIIGWVIVIAIVVFLIWFFKKKYRGAKKDVDLLDVARGRK